MKLTETKDGLRKEHLGIELSIQKGANLGIVLLKKEPSSMLIMQLDNEETSKLACYLGGDKLLCSSIKRYESMIQDSIDRMEHLRSCMKEACNNLQKVESRLEVNSKEYRMINHTISKIKKEIWDAV